MRKVIVVLSMFFLVFFLVSCGNEPERVVIESTVTYDLIGQKSIEVNGEVFTTFCRQDKGGEMTNVFGSERTYTDSNGDVYTAYKFSPCQILYNNKMYHGFDLLEDDTLILDELELLGFPFDKLSD